MKFSYTGNSVAIPARQRAKLEAKLQKLSKMLERRGEKEAHIVLTQERFLHKAEITVNAWDHALVGIATNGDIRIFAKDLEDGSKAVGLFNVGTNSASGSVQWADLKLEGKRMVRDLWRQKDVGTFADSFTASVPRHGVCLVRIWQ